MHARYSFPMILRSPLSRRTFLSSGLATACALVARDSHAEGEPPGASTLTWYGQSCFLLETPRGTRVLMDPLGKGYGFPVPVGVRADLVTISHEHADHANLGVLGTRAHVLRGLTADKKGWLKIDEKYRDVSVRSVGVYHDDRRGTERGLDTVFVFEVAGLRLAHLGDLGHLLTDEQRSEIGAVDVVLLPVGGGGALDAEQATQVMQQLRPRLMVVPMHYQPPRAATSPETPPAPEPPKAATTTKTARGKSAPPPPPVVVAPPRPFGTLETVDAFLVDKTNVRKVPGFTLTLSQVKPRPGTEIVVLGAAGVP